MKNYYKKITKAFFILTIIITLFSITSLNVFAEEPTKILAEDFLKLESDGEIKLDYDYKLTDQLEITNDLTIDLNGHTIIGNGVYAAITYYGTGKLTIKDNGTGGKIIGLTDPTNYSAATVMNIRSGTIDISCDIINSNPFKGFAILNHGTAIISGGTVQANGSGGVAIQNDGTLTVTNGTVQANGVEGVAISNKGTTTISGGTVTASGAAISNSCNLIINGGDISGAPTIFNFYNATIDESDNINLTIKGGTFRAINPGAIINSKAEGNKTITVNIYDGAIISTDKDYVTPIYNSADENGKIIINIYGGEISNTNPDDGNAIDNPTNSDGMITVNIMGDTEVFAEGTYGIAISNSSSNSTVNISENSKIYTTGISSTTIQNSGNLTISDNVSISSNSFNHTINNSANATLTIKSPNVTINNENQSGCELFNKGTIEHYPSVNLDNLDFDDDSIMENIVTIPSPSSSNQNQPLYGEIVANVTFNADKNVYEITIDKIYGAVYSLDGKNWSRDNVLTIDKDDTEVTVYAKTSTSLDSYAESIKITTGNSIAEAEFFKTHLKLESDIGTVIFDEDATKFLETLGAVRNFDFEIKEIHDYEKYAYLTKSQQDSVGENKVYMITLKVNGKVIHDFSGTANVILSGDFDENSSVYYLDDNGNLSAVPSNLAENLSFLTTHFSYYVVSNEEIDEEIFDIGSGEGIYDSEELI